MLLCLQASEVLQLPECELCAQVCPVDSEWVQHILPRLWDV